MKINQLKKDFMRPLNMTGIDCKQVTNLKRTDNELQEFFIFAVAVAGKPSKITEAKVNCLLEKIYEAQDEERRTSNNDLDAMMVSMLGPLEYLGHIGWDQCKSWFEAPLPKEICNKYWIKSSVGGLGKYNTIWKPLIELVTCSLMFKRGQINKMLRFWPISKLEQVPGVKHKTSRFFLLHSRPGMNCVPLDTHILRYLRHRGVQGVPNKTPGNEQVYHKFERLALAEMNWEIRQGTYHDLPDADLSIWKEYSGNFDVERNTI